MTAAVRPARILFVCTANRCRSPFAAALAARTAATLPVDVASAGTDARDGQSVPDTGLLVAREHGLELRDHRAVRLDPAMIAQADLVLAMARRHARDVLELDRSALPHTFTVKQFGRWVRDHPRPRRAMLRPWLDAVTVERPATVFVGEDPDDDIADPIGRPAREWRRMAAVLDRQVTLILAGLYRPRPPRGAG